MSRGRVFLRTTRQTRCPPRTLCYPQAPWDSTTRQAWRRTTSARDIVAEPSSIEARPLARQLTGETPGFNTRPLSVGGCSLGRLGMKENVRKPPSAESRGLIVRDVCCQSTRRQMPEGCSEAQAPMAFRGTIRRFRVIEEMGTRPILHRNRVPGGRNLPLLQQSR